MQCDMADCRFCEDGECKDPDTRQMQLTAYREVAGQWCTHYYQCSNCKGAIDIDDKYCRHCGAKIIERR